MLQELLGRWSAGRINKEGLVARRTHINVHLEFHHKEAPHCRKFSFRGTIEGISACLHAHHQHPQRPHVHLRRVVHATETFGRQVTVLSTSAFLLLQQRLVCFRVPEIARSTKAGQLDVFFGVEQNVLQLQESMCDAKLLQIVDGVEQLLGPGARLLRVDVHLVEDEHVERLAGTVLHEDEQLLFQLKDVKHLDEVLALWLLSISAHEAFDLQRHQLQVLNVARRALGQVDLLEQHLLVALEGCVEFVDIVFDDQLAHSISVVLDVVHVLHLIGGTTFE